MNPILMTVIFASTLGMFAWSAQRRTRLLLVGAPDTEFTFDVSSLTKRVENVLVYALGQKKMANNPRYSAAGIAHITIFAAFQILLLNTVVLWGRAYDESFDFFGLLAEDNIVGQLYSFAKEIIVGLCIAGCGVFFYYRVISPQKRMTLSGEGLLILFIIASMMTADYVYVGGRFALEGNAAWHWWAPVGSGLGLWFRGFSPGTQLVLEHVGFWWHATWVLLFLNILPYSKHFHIITSLPNVFGQKLDARGKLPDVDDIEGKIEREEPIGVGKIEHLDQKQILDLYTCTECGRCSDNCPAFTTGKKLSPKHLTLALRDHLYDLEEHFLGNNGIEAPGAKKADASAHVHGDPPEGAYFRKAEPVQLVPDIVAPEVIWACTTCRACEEQCPVNISYVDKIVSMRRAEMMVKNEFPKDLQKAFKGMETNGNPWNLPAMDRGNWATGLDKEGVEVRFLADHPDAEVVYWVGCAAEYDDRSKKVARAVAKLLDHAGVSWAAMGSEATCTGDPARRAGNEYLFQTLANANVETLNGAGVAASSEGKGKVVLTACPHCFNTLKNEYPSFGGKYDVVHHSDYLNGLIARGLITPTKEVRAKIAYHDSCYLGRYNDVYESPRAILKAIPGVELVEVEYWNKQKGLCCGAGGAQMWKEEEHSHGEKATRVNKKRTLQLLDTGATKVASGCPFCMTMISNSIDDVHAEREEAGPKVENLDLAELLDRSVDYAKRGEREDAAAE
ncbi:MAG: (Fe-S)-binding protein [Sandaracinus sp.]